MGDSCAEVSALEGAMEPEAEAMEEVLRAFNRWQQVARSSSENRQREITTKMENHVQQAIDTKLQDMENRLEEKMKRMVEAAFEIMKDHFEEIMANKIESALQTYMNNEKKKQAETAAAMAREKERRDQLVTNQARSFSAQLSPPMQVGSSTASKRPAPLRLDSLSAPPMKRERPLQGDSTPTPSVADSASQRSSPFFTPTMQPSSSTLPLLNNQQTALCKAVKTGRMDDVINYLEFHVDPNFRDEEGDSLLHIAVKNSRSRVLKELFARGVQIPVDAVDSAGRTALHVAASNAKGGSSVDILLKQNADVNSRDGKGDTPLHCAARNGYEKIVRKLLGKGANAEIQNNEGWTPIHVAKPDVVQNILISELYSPTEPSIPSNSVSNPIPNSISNPSIPVHPLQCLSTSLSPPYEENGAAIEEETSDDDITEIPVVANTSI